MVTVDAPTDTRPPLLRWRCAECGEEGTAQEVAWLDHLRTTHHCPTPEQIKRALRGQYDG